MPGIPASIADALFNPVAAGGLGLNKLQFYSPRNGFRYFPSNPALGNGGGVRHSRLRAKPAR